MLGKQNKQSKINQLKLGNNLLNNPKDIAEGFNNYFANIGPNLAEKFQTSVCDAETYVKKATSEFTAFQPTTVNNVYQLLNGLLSSAQFGFRKSHSTATVFLDCTNEWYVNIDKKLFNLVDLKKAI